MTVCTRCHKNKPTHGYQRCEECRAYTAAAQAKRLTPEFRAERERIQKLRDRGRCLSHPRRQSEVGDWCWECVENRRQQYNQRNTELRRRHIAEGRCIQCVRPAVPGRMYCEEHREYVSEYQRTKGAEANRRAVRAMYYRRVRAGLCVRCGKVDSNGWRMCDACAAHVNERANQRNARKKR